MPAYHDYLGDFATLFATVDPIGTVPIFLAAAGTRDPRALASIANRAVLVAGAVLIFFLFAGEYILHGLGIGIPSFQLAGGAILFLIGLSMLFGGPADADAPADPAQDVAIFPIAIPAIAGPGTMMAVVVLTDPTRFSPTEQLHTGLVLVAVLGIQWILLRVATKLVAWLGTGVINVVRRVMGLLLAALAVEIGVGAVRTLVAG